MSVLYSAAKSVPAAGATALDGSRLETPLSAVSRLDSKLAASAPNVGSMLASELMMGSRIASNSSAWAAGAFAHGVNPNANAAPAVALKPTARRRRALLLDDRRFRLL